ncbi:MAG TPA: antitoxin [Thermodesulfobacteriota bacterium]|nr:antitoxin [Thermodesulfobacteriota bacterium]
MRKEYDFTKSIKNPYSKKLKKQVTILLENEIIDYFKKLAAETDIPYQKLINLFLRECAGKKLKPAVSWEETKD